MTGPVQVDDKAIDVLGKKFTDFADTEVQQAIDSLNDITVAPGDFADAETLRATVTARTASLRTSLTNIQSALRAIGNGLTTVATTYRNTEKDNEVGATALDTMIQNVGKSLPGFVR